MTKDDARAMHLAAVDAGYASLAGYIDKWGKDAEVTDATLQKLVSTSLDNATENGFAMSSLSNDEIARDLCNCDADLESIEPARLLPFIQAWREQQP